MSDPYGAYPPPPPPVPQREGYPVDRAARPATVDNAVRLMFANAGLSLLAIVVSLLTVNDLRDRYLRANPGTGDARLDSVVNTTITIGIGIAVVVLVLYVLLALQVRSGRNWARIVTWVFAGLGVAGLVNAFSSTATPLSRTLSVVQGLVDIVIIVLLAMGDSNRFFRRPELPRW